MPSEYTSTIDQITLDPVPAPRRNADRIRLPRKFLWLWSGQGVSIVGSQLSSLAIQVIAVSSLGANALQMGFLTASQTIPYLVLSLFVGLMVDRASKRRLLIASDVIRCLTMIVAALLLLKGRLSVGELCAVVCFISVFNLVFDAALGALVPAIFNPAQRLSVNSRLNMTASGGDVVGPTLAGIVLDALRASGAMLLDALTYLISAVCIWLAVPRARPRDTSPGAERSIRVVAGIKEGISFVGKHPLLRTFAVGSAVWNFSWSAVLAVLVIQLSRHLHLSATQTGLVFAAGGIGGILGAGAGSYLGRQWKTQLVLVLAPVIGVLGGAVLLIDHPSYPFATAAFGMLLYGVGESCFGVNMQTCRQAVTPISLMGRMDTTMRFCFKGMASLGAITGGVVATHGSVRAAICFGVAGLLAASIGIAASLLLGRSAAWFEK